jgi:hypothetical protein
MTTSALELVCARCGEIIDIRKGASSSYADQWLCGRCVPDEMACGCESLAGFSRRSGAEAPRKAVPGWTDITEEIASWPQNELDAVLAANVRARDAYQSGPAARHAARVARERDRRKARARR